MRIADVFRLSSKAGAESMHDYYARSIQDGYARLNDWQQGWRQGGGWGGGWGGGGGWGC